MNDVDKSKMIGRVLRIVLALAAFGALALIAMIMDVSPSLADKGPHQGSGFGNSPDYCAACHRVHTAVGPKLLKEADQKALCLSCHGAGGPGADTDVSNGLGVASAAGLKGGGFINARMAPDLAASTTWASVTSTHINDGTSGTAWGGGPITSTSSYTGTAGVTLECANCHNPHGNGQYRILRKQPLEGYGSSDVSVITGDSSSQTYNISYSSSAGYRRDTSYAPSTIGDWCAQCHTRYSAGSGAGSSSSTDQVFKYRHYTSGLTGRCLECHVAHGTTATMSTYSGGVPWPGGAIGGGANDSRLLHVNNRGVCMKCHTSVGSGN